MTYKTAYFCVKCNEEVSDYTRMDSHGRCPHCGFKGRHACTIMDTKERAYCIVWILPEVWWKLWTIRAKREYQNNG